MRRIFLASVVLSCVPAFASASSACYQDPVYDQSGTVEATADVRVRSAACVTGTSVLFTAKRGARLELTGRTDGWYRVRDAQGREGWVYDGMSKVVSSSVPVSAAAASYAPATADTLLLNGVYDQLAKRPSDWLTAVAARASALSSKVAVPRTAYVLSEVARMAREIAASRAAASASTATVSAATTTATTASSSAAAPRPSAAPAADVPAAAQTPAASGDAAWNIPDVDEARVRAAWLGWYNAVRADMGLAAYAYDPRLDATALEWSRVAQGRGSISHKRDPKDASAYRYSAIEAWFKDRGVTFANVSRTTFTENIGFGYFSCPSSGDCTQAAIDGIRSTFDMYMAEKTKPGSWGQAHYLSVVNAQFRIVGLGLVRDGNKYYLTVHYGTSIK